MATVSGTFTAVGQSATLDVPALGEDITISLTGGATATVLLEREKVPHADVWQVIRTYFGNVETSFRQERKNERYRFNVTSYTTGTVTYSVSDGDKVVSGTPFVDSRGNVQMTLTQAGINIPGTLTVDGASDLSSVTHGTLTPASGSITDTSGAISFGDENLSTTGTLAAGATTITGGATFADGATDVDIASHDATNGLKLGGVLVSATAAEINLVDGSSATSPAVSTAAILDSAGALRTAENVGTAGSECTAVEYGDGYNHVTIITCTAADLAPALSTSAAEGIGAVIYTFPIGVYVAQSIHANLTAVVAVGFSNAVDFGFGSLIASGDITTLSTAAMEDWLTGQTIDDISSPATEKSTVMTAGSPLLFEAAGSHVLNLNMAGTWTAAADTIEATAVVTIWWTFLGA